MRSHDAARTLLVDLQHVADGATAGGGASSDPLAALPPPLEVEAHVRRALERGGGRRGGDGSEGLPSGSRRCVEALLAIVETARSEAAKATPQARG